MSFVPESSPPDPSTWHSRFAPQPAPIRTTLVQAIGLALLSWLPIQVWALSQGRLLPGRVSEPLLYHSGIPVLCLVAIPLLVLGEPFCQRVFWQLLPQFPAQGILVGAQVSRFDLILTRMARLRDHPLVLVGIGVATALITMTPPGKDALSWAREGLPSLGFGGLWFVWVARPIYGALLLRWCWRLLVVTLLFVAVCRLGLQLVPNHPDRSMGLGFLELLPEAFAPMALAMSSVACAFWTHQLLHHDRELMQLRLPFLVFVCAVTLLLLAPLLVFVPPMLRARRRALLDYGALVAAHGRLVHRRWIEAAPVESSALLEAPELGPSVDVGSLYQAVWMARRSPISRLVLVKVLLPLLLPAVLGLTSRFPLSEMLLNVGKALL
jgi:hypothetical protein